MVEQTPCDYTVGDEIVYTNKSGKTLYSIITRVDYNDIERVYRLWGYFKDEKGVGPLFQQYISSNRIGLRKRTVSYDPSQQPDTEEDI